MHVSGGSFTTVIGIGIKTGSAVAGVGLANVAILLIVGREVRHGGGNFQLSNYAIGSLNAMTSGSSPSILPTTGNLTLTGCTFPDARPPVTWQSGGSN